MIHAMIEQLIYLPNFKDLDFDYNNDNNNNPYNNVLPRVRVIPFYNPNMVHE